MHVSDAALPDGYYQNYTTMTMDSRRRRRKAICQGVTSYVLCISISLTFPVAFEALMALSYSRRDFTRRLKWKPAAQRAMTSNYTCNTTTSEPSMFVASHEEALFYAVAAADLNNNNSDRYYPPDIHCRLAIHLEPPVSRWNIMVGLLGSVYLADTDGSRDTLTVYRGNPVEGNIVASISGYRKYTDIPPIIVNGSDVTLQFDTGGKEPRAAGFHLLYNVFRWAENGACSDNEFLCDLNFCLPIELKCDEIVHCYDGTDEKPYCGPEWVQIEGIGDMYVKAYCIIFAFNVVGTVAVVFTFNRCYRWKERKMRDEIVNGTVAPSVQVPSVSWRSPTKMVAPSVVQAPDAQPSILHYDI
ncbi:hypothetical protein LSAT2_018853 [Lamellibrachia satsuma]|nr:hypothetical protein LSAT2_018853 [Lamellibrachia satsuma]